MTKTYQLRGACGALYASKAREVILCGPADCIHGDTIIEGTGKSIKWLCDNNIAPIVKTMLGEFQAEVPFLKGEDWLHEVVLSTGERFKATAKHLVLTESGFEPISNCFGKLLVGNGFGKRVVAITKCEFGPFYDITVPGAHHYLAAGVVHHNTGKSFAACAKAHAICASVAGAQGAIIRKTAVSVTGTALRTFKNVTETCGLQYYGGETPSRIIYPNGSTIWLGGMDNPDRVLGAERDFIYVSQAEELSLHDWETLLTRCTGRGAKVQHPQLFADCNPAGSKHWIRDRAKIGKLTLLNAVHKDNPTLYDLNGKLMPGAEARLAALDALTGVRRKRLLEGIWATAEGAVFDTFDSEIHVKERNAEEFGVWHLCLDEGYTNPAAILLVGVDSDGRWHVEREFYKRNIIQSEVVKIALEWWKEKRVQEIAVDAAAAGLIADLADAGIPARGGKGRILDGIQRLQDRLKVQGDGKPRMTISQQCIETINEFESHIWKPERDVPLDKDNHSIAALRYLGDVLGESTGAVDLRHVPTIQRQQESELFAEQEIDFTESDIMW